MLCRFSAFGIEPESADGAEEGEEDLFFFFFDNGIRNALIQNLNPLALRNDAGCCGKISSSASG